MNDLFGIVESTKRCARCGNYKPLSEFNQHADTPVVHRQPYCRQCQHEYAREHYRAAIRRGCADKRPMTDEQRKAYGELYERYKRYRIALEAYRDMYGGEPEDRLAMEFALGL